MAENTTSAAPAGSTEAKGAPTSPPAATPAPAPTPGAGIDPLDFLAQVETEAATGAETKSGAETEAAAPEAQADDTAATTTEDNDTKTAADTVEDEDETDAVPESKDEPPAWATKRIAKLTEQKHGLKAKIAEAEAARQQAEEALAKAAADKTSPLPSGPLAHLDTTEKLNAEVAKAGNFLEWVENNPDQALASYRDDERSTSEEKLAADKRYALYIVKNQPHQSAILKAREESLAAARKAAPSMFDAKHEDHAYLASLLQGDPRERTDFYDLVRDALETRHRRADEASGKVKWQRIDIAAAKANGAKGAAVSAAKTNGHKVPPKYVPPVTAARAPVVNGDGLDHVAQLWQQSRKGAVDIEDMITAGAL